jgi:hypothetical protein
VKPRYTWHHRIFLTLPISWATDAFPSSNSLLHQTPNPTLKSIYHACQIVVNAHCVLVYCIGITKGKKKKGNENEVS